MLLCKRFELGDEAVVAAEVAVAVGLVTKKEELVQEVVVVVVDVELAIGIGVWLDSLVGLEDVAAEEDELETVMVCFTVDDTSAESSGDLIVVEEALVLLSVWKRNYLL